MISRRSIFGLGLGAATALTVGTTQARTNENKWPDRRYERTYGALPFEGEEFEFWGDRQVINSRSCWQITELGVSETHQLNLYLNGVLNFDWWYLVSPLENYGVQAIKWPIYKPGVFHEKDRLVLGNFRVVWERNKV